MLSEKQLRDALVSAFEHLREQRSTISSLTVEVAALRESLCEIGPAYDDILSRHRGRHAKVAKPVLSEALRQYDAIIQRLRSGSL